MDVLVEGDETVNEITETLLALTESISAASERADADTLDYLVADDYIAVFGDRVASKAHMIARWCEPTETASHEIRDAAVHDFGDIGIVTAEVEDRWTAGGVDYVSVERVFDVWRRRDERWQLIASHSAPVDPSP